MYCTIPITIRVDGVLRHTTALDLAGDRQLKRIENVLRDQNDQTERKIESENTEREERLVSASLTSRCAIDLIRAVLDLASRCTTNDTFCAASACTRPGIPPYYT